MEEFDKTEDPIEDLKLKAKDITWGLEQLKLIPVFASFTDEELADVYLHGELKEHKSGNSIVIEGENSRGLYMVLAGVVSVFKTDLSSSSMVRLANLDAGKIFGEMSLFDDTQRSATVICEVDCLLFYLDFEKFSQFLEESSDNLKVRFYKRCSEDLAQKFRLQNTDYILSQKRLWEHVFRK